MARTFLASSQWAPCGAMTTFLFRFEPDLLSEPSVVAMKADSPLKRDESCTGEP